MAKRFLFVTLCLLLPCAAVAEECGVVKHVINGKSFVLESGDTVRMAALQVPNVADETRPGEPLGAEAKAALAARILGKEVCLRGAGGATPEPDRHGRKVAMVYDRNGEWIQAEQLKAGWAMVYSFSDSSKSAPTMLGFEREARVAKRGIWAHPRYRVVTPEEALGMIDRFAIVEGVVTQAMVKKNGAYINFGSDWNTDFTLFIARKYLRRFKGMDWAGLAGKHLRSRGWVYSKGGGMIDLNHPEQIEILR